MKLIEDWPHIDTEKCIHMILFLSNTCYSPLTRRSRADGFVSISLVLTPDASNSSQANIIEFITAALSSEKWKSALAELQNRNNSAMKIWEITRLSLLPSWNLEIILFWESPIIVLPSTVQFFNWLPCGIPTYDTVPQVGWKGSNFSLLFSACEGQ